MDDIQVKTPHREHQHLTQEIELTQRMLLIMHNLRIKAQFSTSQKMEKDPFSLVLVHSSSKQAGLCERLPTSL